MASQEILREEPSRGSFINDPKVRSLVFQAVVVVVLGALVWWIVQNTIDNLTRLHIASGFGFLKGRAGFDISDTPIAYTSDSTYGRAIVVGFINTLIVAAVGIVTATIIGFIVGIGRLSQQLADPQDLHCLCRDLPQHSAAAGHLLLVFRRACGAAAAARKHPFAVRFLPQPARHFIFRAPCGETAPG